MGSVNRKVCKIIPLNILSPPGYYIVYFCQGKYFWHTEIAEELFLELLLTVELCQAELLLPNMPQH